MQKSQAAIYIDRREDGYSIGLSMYEPYGLKGWIGEIKSEASHPYSAIDRTVHLLLVTNVHSLLIGAESREYIDEIIDNFSTFDCRYIERQFELNEQNGLFKKIFDIHSLLSPVEHLMLESRPLAAQALAILADCLHQEDRNLHVMPTLLETESWMELGNNPLEQLEMINPDIRHPSIATLMLTMSTSMGKRLGRFRLFLPIRDKDELRRRYEWIETVQPHTAWLREKLLDIGEIELFWQGVQIKSGGDTANFCSALIRVIELQRFCLQHKLMSIFPSRSLLDGWDIECKNNTHNAQWIEEQSPFVHEMIEWIAQLDVAVASAINAQRYALVRPNIVETKGENFLQIRELRHLLVEEQHVRYVPNDIVMGDREYLDLPYPETVMLDSRVHDGASIRGVLLYGINSSGKSSLMKSLGIAVALAQGGFFVPAKAMKFSLFDGIYTRIQSRDNVAKSLSTFGVEMLELNTIFSRSTNRSLVLGDEISHGTETLSAVSIVASTIMELHRKGALFLMTTHLHQLSMIKELNTLREVVSLHLSVRYDEATDRLIYDRILKRGRGSSVYGLEFAESLHMAPEFLKNAKRLRENLAKEYDVLELGNHKEYIKRYREVVACECVICGALIRNPQKNIHAKEHHHLIPLCETHTRQIVQGKIKLQGFIMTREGLRLEYETQLKED